MEKLLCMIKTRIAILKKAIEKARKEEPLFPKGHLRISSLKHQTRYYQIVKTGDTQGEYISAKNRKIAEALAQKDYNRQFLKQATKELSRLETIYDQLSRHNADLAYENLSDARKCLVTPYIITDELYAKEWQATPFKGNPYMPENKKYVTGRGEAVRSKSEAILADMLCELGIPYHYEKPLRLKNGITRYPDFTLLKVKTREEIYLEHFGLLDDEEYRKNCLQKLIEYRNNDIYPGKNLIFTYETSENPLDTKGIRKMLKDLLL